MSFDDEMPFKSTVAEMSFSSNDSDTSINFNRTIGSPVEDPGNQADVKVSPEPSSRVLRFDQDIAPKTFGGPHLLDSLVNQYRGYTFEELDEMTNAYELLRTRVITGWFRSDLINVNVKFNWTGLDILSNSLLGFAPQDQLHHINHNLNMIRTVVEEKMLNDSTQPQPLEAVASGHNQPEELPGTEEEMSKNLADLLGIKSSSPVKSAWMSPLPDSIYTSERSI